MFAKDGGCTNNSNFLISQNLVKFGYPYGYNLLENKICHTFNEGLVDSTKSVRAIIWNAITIVSTIITSD